MIYENARSSDMKKWILLFVAVFWGCYIGGLYAFQDNLIFYPHHNHITPKESKLSQFNEINVTAEDGTKIRLWYS